MAPSPDLREQLGGGDVFPPEEQAANTEHNAVVDNHVFRDAAGVWHC